MSTAASSVTVRPAPSPRSALRTVAMPTEHGGWGLTGEPAILGLLLAPSWAGACLSFAAVLAFVVRTPLRVALVDHHRDRRLPRTALAWKVLAVELAAAGALVTLALALAAHPFWWPIAAAAPLVAVELWFGARSRSRRLVPELAGAIGVSGVAAAIVLAGSGGDRLALGAWLVVAARATTAIPHVRAQVQRLHGRAASAGPLIAADAAALTLAALAVAIEPAVAAGAAAIVALVALGWALGRSPAPAKVLGLRQTFFGLAVVIATAAGFHLT